MKMIETGWTLNPVSLDWLYVRVLHFGKEQRMSGNGLACIGACTCIDKFLNPSGRLPPRPTSSIDPTTALTMFLRNLSARIVNTR